MAFTYFAGSDVYIYPSANADDSGDLSTEKNLSKISENLSFQNHIIDKRLTEDSTAVGFHNAFDVDGYTGGSFNFNLYPGQCVLSGRNIEIRPKSSTCFSFNLKNMAEDQGYSFSNTPPHLLLVLLQDLTGNVSSDLVINGVRTCRGIALVVDDPDSQTWSSNTVSGKYIDLGYFNLSPQGSPIGITEFIPNPLRFTYIDQSSVRVGEEDLESHLSNITDEKVKQIEVSSGSGKYYLLGTQVSEASGTIISPVSYVTNFSYGSYIGGLAIDNMPLYLRSGTPLYLSHSRFHGTEIFLDSDGKATSLRLLHTCTTEASTASKTISLIFNSLASFVSGVTIKVQFTNSNTASDPSINGLPIYLQDGTVCPWYAINNTSSIYEFTYYNDGNGTTATNPKWILLNPTENPAITRGYYYGHRINDAIGYLYIDSDEWAMQGRPENNFEFAVMFKDSWENCPYAETESVDLPSTPPSESSPCTRILYLGNDVSSDPIYGNVPYGTVFDWDGTGWDISLVSSTSLPPYRLYIPNYASGESPIKINGSYLTLSQWTTIAKSGVIYRFRYHREPSESDDYVELLNPSDYVSPLYETVYKDSSNDSVTVIWQQVGQTVTFFTNPDSAYTLDYNQGKIMPAPTGGEIYVAGYSSGSLTPNVLCLSQKSLTTASTKCQATYIARNY